MYSGRDNERQGETMRDNNVVWIFAGDDLIDGPEHTRQELPLRLRAVDAAVVQRIVVGGRFEPGAQLGLRFAFRNPVAQLSEIRRQVQGASQPLRDHLCGFLCPQKIGGCDYRRC